MPSVHQGYIEPHACIVSIEPSGKINVAVPAAVANAVFDAIGVRLTDLPITAEQVYAGLRAKEGRK